MDIINNLLASISKPSDSLTTTLWTLQTISLHLATLSLLAIRRIQLDKQQNPSLFASTLMIRYVGISTAAVTLLLPYQFSDAFAQCGVRVVCVFYAFKLLDLALTQSTDPPILLDKDTRKPVRLTAPKYIVHYVWLLLTSMRYHRFSIHTRQTGRPKNLRANFAFPLVFLPVLVGFIYLYPIAELKCLTLLLLLNLVFEALHSLLHPSCPEPLFLEPFAAKSMSSFWSTHWHGSATPWLTSLGYRSGKKVGGRAGGMLAVFALSGVWHAWASLPLVEEDCQIKLAAWVVGLFMLFGILILVEGALGWREGGTWWRRFIWALSLGVAGQAFRLLERCSIVPWLRQE